MSLWLARHARPLVASGLCYGALDMDADDELTRLAAQGLAHALPAGVTVLVSPLRRCQQLADALASLRADLPMRTDARLREMDFGCWEGVPWADIPRAAVDAWTANFADHRFGGKESASEVLQRVASIWAEREPGRHTLWITHSGVVKAASLRSAGTQRIQSAADWPAHTLAYGAWQEM